ncbi:MAG TPA: hypothetical protein VHT27_04715 [Solirubrobacteraceae bacterium]|jgi:preprotein translocase subunit SecG|nr:hypothetical protein [Solirubrobacteraceae bacterium]
MRRLLTRAISYALLLLLVLAPAAGAFNDGRGFYGATDDKVVTDAGFILIVAFPLFVLFMSLLQKRLERRKDERKAAAKAQMQNAHLRGGW